MADDVTKRMKYFDRQFLRASDFQVEQAYHIDRHRRHTRLLHQPGVAEGLEVAGTADPTMVTVSRGTAIDSEGREIVVLAPQTKQVSVSAGTTRAEIYIAYGQGETDSRSEGGVTGSTRITESPAFPMRRIEPGPAETPPNAVLLAEVSLDGNGRLTTAPNNAVRTRAGAVVRDDLTVRTLTLKRDGIAVSQWPRLSCSQANEASLENSSLMLDANREVIFQSQGQMRSSGNMLFVTGTPNPTEKMTILADGNVGIGTTSPGAKLEVAEGHITILGTSDTFDQTLSLLNNSGKLLRLTVGANGGGTAWYTQANTGTLGVDSGMDLRFSAGAAEAMRITSSGNVGIGTPNPVAPLHVQGPANTHTAVFSSTPDPAQPWPNQITLQGSGVRSEARLGFATALPDGSGAHTAIVKTEVPTNGGGDLVFQIREPGFVGITERMRITNGGNIGIGTAPSFKLDVAGEVHASSFPVSSDTRFKTDITPLTNVLEKLEKIRGISFAWNELYESLGRSTGRREIGVMAQEVEDVFPEVVTTWGDEGYKAVDYGRLTAVLLEAVKELKAETPALKQRIEALERATAKKGKKGNPKTLPS